MSATDTILIAIDPGPEQSGWVRYLAACHHENEKPVSVECGILDNETLRRQVSVTQGWGTTHVVIEMTASMGMRNVGDDVHETTYWIGRFDEASAVEVTRIKRHAVKIHLCGDQRAGKPDIRQRLIDLWGGIQGKRKAIGLKKMPGPLYDVQRYKGHVWDALALAVTWWETCFTAPGEVE